MTTTNDAANRKEVLDYYSFLIEDRFGMSAEITRSGHSFEIQMHEEAVTTPVEAHMFCNELTHDVMDSFKVFVPFKVYDPEENLITLETYAQFWDTDVIPHDDSFIVNMDDEQDEEEQFNFG